MPLNVNPLEPGIFFVEFFAESFFRGENAAIKIAGLYLVLLPRYEHFN